MSINLASIALLRIDCLVPISWDTVAFDELVLPENHRALLKAVVASHFKTREKRLDTSTAGSKQGKNHFNYNTFPVMSS